MWWWGGGWGRGDVWVVPRYRVEHVPLNTGLAVKQESSGIWNLCERVLHTLYHHLPRHQENSFIKTSPKFPITFVGQSQFNSIFSRVLYLLRTVGIHFVVKIPPPPPHPLIIL